MAASKATTAKKRSASKRRVEKGCVHIHAAFNNTIVTITDTQGNTISWSSAGKLKYRGSKKSSAYVAQCVAVRLQKFQKLSKRQQLLLKTVW